jgi:hypothetical protein
MWHGDLRDPEFRVFGREDRRPGQPGRFAYDFAYDFAYGDPWEKAGKKK